jgi:hypothetical protein
VHPAIRWFGLAALGLAVAAGAGAEPAPTISVLSPRDGETLVAGGDAELAWEPAASSAGWHAEEWEIFLSLDGGRTWPVRLTPHLDWDRRRVTFRVPPTPSEQVRLLLRVGDERDELAIPLPLRLTIAAGAAPTATPSFGVTSPTLGEAALPGERGVSLWVDGPRDGGWSEQVVATPPPGLAPVRPYLQQGLAVDSAQAPLAPPAPRVRAPRLGVILPLPRRLGTTRLAARASGRQLRSLLTQRNE